MGPDGSYEYAWKELKSDADDSEIERFEREIQILSTIDHDCIVPVLYSNAKSSTPYFIMPKARMNLDVAIKFDINWQIERKRLIKQICSAVIHAHSNGIIHRDIKPENVLMFSGFSAKLSDFGLARKIDPSVAMLTKTSDTGGTRLYAAPEQYNTSMKEVDERADLYSIAKIIYYVYTRDHPYHMDFNHPKLPEALRYVVQKATQHDREKRFSSVQILLQRFLDAVEEKGPSGSPDQLLTEYLGQRRITPENNSQIVEKIGELFLSEAGNRVFFLKHFPRIPSKIWIELGKQDWDLFRSVLNVYDDWVSGALPFDYTDMVADLYRSLLVNFQDREFRVKIIARLCQMGFSHNRFYVREVVCEIMEEIELSVGIKQELADFISENRPAAQWTLGDRLEKLVSA